MDMIRAYETDYGIVKVTEAEAAVLELFEMARSARTRDGMSDLARRIAARGNALIEQLNERTRPKVTAYHWLGADAERV